MKQQNTESISDCVRTYTASLRSGDLPLAYRAILSALLSFRTAWQREHPQDKTGGLYQGYLDMSFVAVSPPRLANRRLKISLVYLHAEGRFSLWLAAENRAIQAEIWNALMGKNIGGDTLTSLRPGTDAIIEREVPPPYAFDEPDALTNRLMDAAEGFVRDMAALILD